MNKKLVKGISTALVIGAIVGCTPVYAEGNSNDESNIVTTTTTTKETDADGNITETTIIERDIDGEKTESKIVEWTDGKTGLKYLKDVPVTIENESDVAIDVFNLALPEDEEWGNDYILEGVVLRPGEKEEDVMLLSVIESGSKFDLRVVDTEGQPHIFEGVELSDISREHASFIFEGNKDDGYAITHTTYVADVE